MKVISIDVGIKNMAYCIFDVSDSVEIKDWQIVSLMNEDTVEHYFCNCCCKRTKKNMAEKICGRIAKYKKGDHLFCEKHAKKQIDYIFPKNIKKMKLEELKEIAKTYGIENIPKKRAEILDVVDEYQKNNGLEPVVKTKGVRANETDLIHIGNNIKCVLNNVLKEHTNITHVLIENQISPLANRMKTVQGMLAQYFIMSYNTIHIEFISSANKLKLFNIKQTTTTGEQQTESQIYKKHKKDGIFYCEKVLTENNMELGKSIWLKCEKKKDDLADCFLQGVWWINRERVNIIKYSQVV
jgi:hypothetical protein